MEWIVIGFGLLAVGLGLLGVVAPTRLLRIVEVWEYPGMVWVAGGLRLFLGLVLWVVAPGSHFPVGLRVLAVVTGVAGVATLLVPRDRVTQIVAWWKSRPPGFLRAWALVAVAFGAFLIGSLWP